jgi:hypothetical protein
MSVEQKIDALNAKVDALVALISAMNGGAAGGAGAGAAAAEDDGSSHASILAFDDLVAATAANFFAACAAIEGVNNLGKLAEVRSWPVGSFNNAPTMHMSDNHSFPRPIP